MDPRMRYASLLQKRREEIQERWRRHRLLGYLRLAMVATAAAVVWAALSTGALSIAWGLLPTGIFGALLVAGNRQLAAIEERRRAAAYFEQGLARLDGRWAGTGNQGAVYADPTHPYARDLDLFGEGSFFEFLCRTKTDARERTLAQWLLAPSPPSEVRKRQEAVEELRRRLDLREDLAVAAGEAHGSANPEGLATWGEAPPVFPSRNLRWLLWVLTAWGSCGFLAFWICLAQAAGAFPLDAVQATLSRGIFLLAVATNGFFLFFERQRIASVIQDLEPAARELRLFSKILFRLEPEQFQSPLLQQLRASLEAAGEPPSRRFRRLQRIVENVESRDNVFVRLLEPFFLWTFHQAVRAEVWRRQSGSAVRRWIAAIGHIEALCSLASYAFERPRDSFPEFLEGGPQLIAEQIGHPLIPESAVVRNDIQIGGKVQLLVVSGSNLSGKSTLLRTLGINVVLAQAGAPVCAARLQLSPLAVGASITVADSLREGVSRFYAELLRLRQILETTNGPLPVLFLIDELLHGTNSHDRRIGAEALVRALIHRGAIGLITTHDLALAEIADALGGCASNVHFEDRIENGKLLFDYGMRPGAVQKSNALALMRSVGLEI
jgi:hypothetical protein